MTGKVTHLLVHVESDENSKSSRFFLNVVHIHCTQTDTSKQFGIFKARVLHTLAVHTKTIAYPTKGKAPMV